MYFLDVISKTGEVLCHKYCGDSAAICFALNGALVTILLTHLFWYNRVLARVSPFVL